MASPRAGVAGGANPWAIALTVGLATFMEVLDISIANVALQHIAGSLSASQDEATWVLTSYLVTNAIVLPVSGWLASRIGRKRYFTGCIAGFSLASLVCGLAPSLGMLIIARGLQGAAGGGLQPNSQAILADTFPPERRGQAFAVYGLAVVFAPAIGPTLGGWITDNFSWRWVFLLNVPIGMALSLLATRMLADPPALIARRKARHGAFDYVGFALLVIGMGALQIVLDKGQEDDWFGSSFITSLSLAAALALVAFVVWELRRGDPIVDLRLLADRNFAVGNLLMFMLGLALLATTTLLPLYVQGLFGYTATDAGLVISPGGFAVMLTMPVVGYLSGKVDSRILVGLGFAGTAAALFAMTRFDGAIDYATIAWARVYQSLPLAFLFIPINLTAMAAIPTAKSNNATAIVNMMRNLGGSFGISIVTTLIARREQYHQSVLVEHVTPLSTPYAASVHQLQQAYLAHSGSAIDALHRAQAAIYAMVQKQAALLSFNDAFWAMAVVLAAMVPLVLLLRKSRSAPGPGNAKGAG
ncbi:MAG TPA: DHA2 family efflux MFS transporter permease subunit [Stellaceae bacterium]